MRRLGRRADEHARGPVAAYAAVLDGRHLWLALDSSYDGTPALRPDAGDLIPLEAERGERWLEVRTDLEALLPHEEATYDVVLKGSRLKPATPIRTEPRTGPSTDELTRTPTTPDRSAVLELERTDEGHLRLRRRTLAPTAELLDIELRDDRVFMHTTGAGGDLLVLDQDDTVLTRLAAEAGIGLGDLPAGRFGMLRLAVGTPEHHLRIRRRADDLADANRAVLLPELVEGDEVRARFRWNPDGLLAVRHLAAGERP